MPTIWYFIVIVLILAEIENIKELVLTERIEAIIPLTYILLTLMAYHGPNAEIMGNIKLKIWQYQTPIENMEDFIFNIGLLLVIDFLSFIIIGILFWKFCNTNVLSILQELQNDFWFYMAMIEAIIFCEVSVR